MAQSRPLKNHLANALRCKECKTDDYIRYCYGEGVIVCTNCGEVKQQSFVDQSAEWRNFSDGNQSGVDVRRGGGVVNPFLQQNGLGTMSVGGNSARYSEFEKIMISAQDRSYNLAQQNIKDWAHTLKLPTIIANKSMEYYEKIQTTRALAGKKNVNALLSAILFMAARHMDNALAPAQLCEVTGAKVKEVHKFFKEAKKVIPEHKSTNPKVFVNNFCNKLQLAQETNNYSQDIAEKIQDHGIIDGKNPRTIASVSIFIGVWLAGQESQKSMLQHLPMVANISEVTIKQAYKNIYNHIPQLLPQKFNHAPNLEQLLSSFPTYLYLYAPAKGHDYFSTDVPLADKK